MSIQESIRINYHNPRNSRKNIMIAEDKGCWNIKYMVYFAKCLQTIRSTLFKKQIHNFIKQMNTHGGPCVISAAKIIPIHKCRTRFCKILQKPLQICMIFIHKKDTLRIMVTNKQQNPNLRMPVESYKKLIWLIINYA